MGEETRRTVWTAQARDPQIARTAPGQFLGEPSVATARPAPATPLPGRNAGMFHGARAHRIVFVAARRLPDGS